MATLSLSHFLGWQGQGQNNPFQGRLPESTLEEIGSFIAMPSYKLFGHNKKKKKNKNVLIAGMSDPS